MIQKRPGKADQILTHIGIKIAEDLVLISGKLPVFRDLRPFPQREKIQSDIDSSFFRLGEQEIQLIHPVRTNPVLRKIVPFDQQIVKMVQSNDIESAPGDMIQQLKCCRSGIVLRGGAEIAAPEPDGNSGTFFKFEMSVFHRQESIFSRRRVQQPGKIGDGALFDGRRIRKRPPLLSLPDDNFCRLLRRHKRPDGGRHDHPDLVLRVEFDPADRPLLQRDPADIQPHLRQSVPSFPPDLRIRQIPRRPEILRIPSPFEKILHPSAVLIHDHHLSHRSARCRRPGDRIQQKKSPSRIPGHGNARRTAERRPGPPAHQKAGFSVILRRINHLERNSGQDLFSRFHHGKIVFRPLIGPSARTVLRHRIGEPHVDCRAKIHT